MSESSSLISYGNLRRSYSLDKDLNLPLSRDILEWSNGRRLLSHNPFLGSLFPNKELELDPNALDPNGELPLDPNGDPLFDLPKSESRFPNVEPPNGLDPNGEPLFDPNEVFPPKREPELAPKRNGSDGGCCKKDARSGVCEKFALGAKLGLGEKFALGAKFDPGAKLEVGAKFALG